MRSVRLLTLEMLMTKAEMARLRRRIVEALELAIAARAPLR